MTVVFASAGMKASSFEDQSMDLDIMVDQSETAGYPSDTETEERNQLAAGSQPDC